MSIRFTKMQGLGNDFVLLDQSQQAKPISVECVRQMADRRQGVGFDQLLIIEPSTQAGCDYFFRVYNADGSQAEQCGNGVRCAARYAVEEGLVPSSSVKFETVNRAIAASWDGQLATVDMGCPDFTPASLPFVAPSSQSAPYQLSVAGNDVACYVVSVGNPHCVLWVDEEDVGLIDDIGAMLSQHAAFPQGVNVGFMRFHSSQQLSLQVYERGAGQTPACGSGACAAMVIGRASGRCDARVQVQQPGGRLAIEWTGPGQPILMQGAAERVFDGLYCI